MNKLKKTLYVPLAAANVLTVLGLWLTGFGGTLNPITWPHIGVTGYAFPALLLMTLAFLALWVVVKLRFAAISIVGLLVAYHPVTLYCPINILPSAEVWDDNTFSIISFNTCNWGEGGAITDEEQRKTGAENTVAYLLEKDADIVCIQEGSITEKTEKLDKHYPYRDTVMSPAGFVDIMIYSRFPILRKQTLHLESKANSAGAFWLNVKGKELIVVNCHLETMGISMDEREEFGQLVRGDKDSGRRSFSQSIFEKIRTAAQKRAPQADVVAQFVRMHSQTPIIVCGDFNDVPQSYAHRTVAKDLTDCYRAVGRGPGFSYRHSSFGIMARIDNMLCSEQLTPSSCYVDNTVHTSDHFPILARIKTAKQ